jgi:hypothetical protein
MTQSIIRQWRKILPPNSKRIDHDSVTHYIRLGGKLISNLKCSFLIDLVFNEQVAACGQGRLSAPNQLTNIK